MPRPGTAAVKYLKGFRRQMVKQILERIIFKSPTDFELKAPGLEFEALESTSDFYERLACRGLVYRMAMENEIFIELLDYQIPHLMRHQAESLQVLAASDLNSGRKSAELAYMYHVLMTYVSDDHQSQFCR